MRSWREGVRSVAQYSPDSNRPDFSAVSPQAVSSSGRGKWRNPQRCNTVGIICGRTVIKAPYRLQEAGRCGGSVQRDLVAAAREHQVVAVYGILRHEAERLGRELVDLGQDRNGSSFMVPRSPSRIRSLSRCQLSNWWTSWGTFPRARRDHDSYGSRAIRAPLPTPQRPTTTPVMSTSRPARRSHIGEVHSFRAEPAKPGCTPKSYPGPCNRSRFHWE